MLKRDARITPADIEQLRTLFGVLSDKTRLNILLSLACGEKNVTALCTELKLSQPAVSHHLGLLRTSNLISSRRLGKQVYYMLHARGGGDAILSFALQHLTVQILARN